MTLQVQKFLREGETIQDLETKYAIKHKRHLQHPNLVLFKYNQLESDFSKKIVCESRGIILDESENWKVISRAFGKFFNHGEVLAAPINWSTARVQEKVDGSLCTLYHYKDEWHVATTGTPDASGEMHLSGKTFAQMFFELLDQHHLRYEPIDEYGWTRYCFYFELTSQFNRVVVQHKEPSLTLLGARNLDTDRELSLTEAVEILDLEFPVKVVKDFPLSSFDDIIATFGTMDPLVQEGYVIFDGENRVKVKHPGYVALHHAKDGMGIKSFIEIVRIGEVSEFLVAFPEFKDEFNEVKIKYLTLLSDIQEDYIRLRHIESQKEFALEAVKTRCSSALFSLRSKKVATIRQFLQEMHIDRVSSMLGY